MSASKRVENGAREVEPLPAELARIVDCVVGATRLWPWEKGDVRAELESHFREGMIELGADGLEPEACVTRLMRGFGDTLLTAKLIRRGKKRGRPMAWKILARTTAVAAVLMVSVAGYAAFAMLRQPSPSVDYVAQLNEPILATAEADRAWPVLREVILRFEPRTDEPTTYRWQMPIPEDEEWAAAAEWIEANRGLLPELIEAASRPIYGFVYDRDETIEFANRLATVRAGVETIEIEPTELDPLDPPVLAVLLPNLSEHRDIVRFLVLHAREQFAGGDFAAAWTSLDTAHRLGVQLTGGPTLIEQLVGVAELRLAHDEARDVLTEKSVLAAEEIATIAESRMMLESPDDIKPNLDGERMAFADVVQYTFTDDGKGNGLIIPSQFAKIVGFTDMGDPGDGGATAQGVGDMLAQVAFHADRKDTVEMYDRIWDELAALRSLPLYDPRRAEADERLHRLENDPAEFRRFALVGVMLPSLTRADELIRVARMDIRATQTVFALARYEAEQGSLPESLERLVPIYLFTVPTDAYSGAALRYVRLDDGRTMLYSVGRNLSDDGGSVVVTEEHGPADIVYWTAEED